MKESISEEGFVTVAEYRSILVNVPREQVEDGSFLMPEGLPWYKPFEIRPDTTVPIRGGSLFRSTRSKSASFSIADIVNYPIQSISNTIFPLGEPDPKAVSLAWQSDTILAIATTKAVQIYNLETQTKRTLSHPDQQNISCIVWKPFSKNVLAVACRKGICIWTLEQLGGSSKKESGIWSATSNSSFHPSTSTSASVSGSFPLASASTNFAPLSSASAPAHVSSEEGYGTRATIQLLASRENPEITSLTWSPNGFHLACASSNRGEIEIWDSELQTFTTIQRGFGSILALSWSPNSKFLYSSSSNGELRIWETKTWTCDWIQKLSGPAKALSWSPNGHYLAFSIENSGILHCLDIGSPQPIFHGKVVKTVDLSYHVIDTTRVGGPISNMAWDETGERMAISFSGSEPGSELIALFAVKISPALEFLPRGYVRLQDSGRQVKSLSFAKSRATGALLAVAWSDYLITFLPLYFVPQNKIP